MGNFKNMPNWAKELVGLLISGVVIFLAMCFVANDVRDSNKTISRDEILKSYGVSEIGIIDNSRSNKKENLKPPSKTDSEHQLKMSAGPVEVAIAASPLDKLKILDIFILVVIWPVGVFFNNIAGKLVRRVYNRFF
jgi:hypothetical protein